MHSTQMLHVNKRDSPNPIDKALKQHYERRLLKRNRFTKAALEIMVKAEPRYARHSTKSLADLILEESTGAPLFGGSS